MIRIELPVLKQVSGTNYNLFELGLGVTGDPNCITSNTQFASTCSITPATVRSADAKAYIDIK